MTLATTNAHNKRVFNGFALRFPVGEIEAWANRYPDDDTAAFEPGRKILALNYTKENLEVIVK